VAEALKVSGSLATIYHDLKGKKPFRPRARQKSGLRQSSRRAAPFRAAPVRTIFGTPSQEGYGDKQASK